MPEFYCKALHRLNRAGLLCFCDKLIKSFAMGLYYVCDK